MDIKDIILDVEKELNVDNLKSKSRKAKYIYARAMVSKLAKDFLHMHPTEIAEGLNVDRCSVLRYLARVFPELKKYEVNAYQSYLKIKESIVVKGFDSDRLELLELIENLNEQDIFKIKDLIKNDYNIQKHQGDGDPVLS